MLSPRTDTILRSLVGRYIVQAVPVPSQSLLQEAGLSVSSATIRNEMARLEHDGYITRRHPSAGSIPSDRGYRYYVETLGDITLPAAQQRLIDHLFHQVETKLEEWLSLTAALLAHLGHNMAVVITPKPVRCRFKHLEIVSLQDTTALLVLVLRGAKVRQQLVTFEEPVSQAELGETCHRLNEDFPGLAHDSIAALSGKRIPAERQLADCVIAIMRAEDDDGAEATFLDGLHLVLEQPEFADGPRVQGMVQLTEHKDLPRMILPQSLAERGVEVRIGRENETELIQECSVVASRYGVPDEAVGSIAVIGPTRMPYAQTIAAIDYLAWLLGRLLGRLYGKEESSGPYNS